MNKDDRINGKQLPRTLDMKTKIKPNTSKVGSLPQVTPQELDKVRRQVLDTVKHALPNARGVLMGNIRWTNQQVKLFQIMLSKVMPDLTHSKVDVEDHTKDPNKMTREELEAIIRRSEKAEEEEDADTVDAVYSEIPDVTPEEAAATFQELDKHE